MAVIWGSCWFLVASLPTIGLFSQVGFSPHADRYTYIPHMGLAVAVAWPLVSLTESVMRRGKGLALAAVMATVSAVAACTAATERQMTMWKDSKSLWSGVLLVEPDNVVALVKAGRYEMQRGDFAAATVLLERATAAGFSEYPSGIAAMAELYARTGRRDDALAMRDWVARADRSGQAVAYLDSMPEFQEWRRQRATVSAGGSRDETVDPSARARFRDGMAAVKRREYRHALGAFQAAVDIDPGYAAAYNNIGMAAIELGDRAAAEKAFRQAISIAPKQADYVVNLVRVLMLMRRHAEALPLCEMAAGLAPHDPEIQRLVKGLRQSHGTQ